MRDDFAPLLAWEVMRLAAVAHALRDPARLQILWLLVQRDDLCPYEFTEALALGQSQVSYHVRLLLEAVPLMQQRRNGWSHNRLAHSGLIARPRTLAPSSETLRVEVSRQAQKEAQDVTHC